MAMRPFLAMTGAEILGIDSFPANFGWMACHFSPYGVHASNLPGDLPPGALLILDDLTPICGHDPRVIAGQLRDCVEALECSAVLLDFQRTEYPETGEMARYLWESLPCPVGVSAAFGAATEGPVVLPPVAPDVPLRDALRGWEGREVWMELGMTGCTISVTKTGAVSAPLLHWEANEPCFSDDHLHCHYRMELKEEEAAFTLWRTGEDLLGLLQEAEGLGVTRAVGLYQELGDVFG